MNIQPPTSAKPRQRGPKPRPITRNPEPATSDWIDPPGFAEAIQLHVQRHGETYWMLHRAVVRDDESFDRKTIQNWVAGTKAPRSAVSMLMLGRIEERYRLPCGYFAAKLPRSGRATIHSVPGVSASERRRLAWHLPDDFESRPSAEREEIVTWVRENVISGSTKYRRYQSEALRTPFALRFPDLALLSGAATSARVRRRGVLQAPDGLVSEVAALVRFKTATLTAIGERRSGLWGQETVEQKIEHLGLLFSALVAAPDGPIKGAGVPSSTVTLALLIFPAVWDWYLNWREARRGFFTAWEADMLELGKALTRADTGWLRQNPRIADALRPVAGLVGPADVARVRADWSAACEAMHVHASARIGEVRRVARVHRDPFEPIGGRPPAG